VKQVEKSPIANTSLDLYLKCKDYTVSRETFSIYIDKESQLLVTTPRPTVGDLSRYYDSDEYISHSDSKKSFIDKVYQTVRNYTIKQKVKLINSFNTTNKSVLDIGSGTGDFLMACKQNGWSIDGVEPNNNANKETRKKTFTEISKDISELGKKQFDVITMWHVLEHVPNLNEYISILKKILKPDGVLVVAVPNHKSYDATHYKEFWAAYDVPRHLWHFSRLSIDKLFQLANMKVTKILPMKFDSFYVSLLSEKYKTGKSNFLKAFLIGLRSNLKARSSKEYSSLIYVIKKI
jgi:ubiquinone/menaquinone biosynthesis C-methylase UbiE